jgi:hypothetical protein
MLKRSHDPRAGRGRDVVIQERYTIHTAIEGSDMRSTYGGDTWHSPNVDIHHALLGNVGGAIAYIGVVFLSDFAFGLTGGIKGSFESMGEPVVWDMKGFMHEVSPSFMLLVSFHVHKSVPNQINSFLHFGLNRYLSQFWKRSLA